MTVVTVTSKVISAEPSGGQLEAIGTLIGKGMDVNARCGPAQQSPLLLATARGNCLAMSQLLSHGADLNFRDANGETALHVFVRGARGSHDALNLLLCSRADVTVKDKQGKTPLDAAIACEDAFAAAELTKALAEAPATTIAAATTAAPAPAPAPAPASAPASAVAPTFCSQCGIPVNGVFCTACGAKQ